MGQASDYLFAPLPLRQSSEAEMPNQECQTDRDSLPSEQSQSARPALPSFEEAEAQDVRNDEYPGSFIFRGLGELLRSVLLLGALDAKDRYLDASMQTDGADDDMDTVSQYSDGTCIRGDVTSEVSASMPAVAVEGESDSTNPSAAEDPSRLGAHEVASVVYLDSDLGISPMVDGIILPHDAAAYFETEIDTDDKLIEEMLVNLARSTDTQFPRPGYPEPTFTPTPPQHTRKSEDHSSALPLFQSFARPSIYPAEMSAGEAPSITYDELQAPADEGHESIGSPSRLSLHDMSDPEIDDEETTTIHKSKGLRLMKTARKFHKGQYHQKKSPVTVGAAKLMNADDPPIRTVAGARKPMIVQSPVRQHSYRPMMVDATESEDELGGGESGEDDEFLAPFNRLEKKNPL
ncbi:MAG: hypothetical protein Q9208_002892 [Pyrenodesmia sp. 3 TL-2023]